MAIDLSPPGLTGVAFLGFFNQGGHKIAWISGNTQGQTRPQIALRTGLFIRAGLHVDPACPCPKGSLTTKCEREIDAFAEVHHQVRSLQDLG